MPVPFLFLINKCEGLSNAQSQNNDDENEMIMPQSVETASKLMTRDEFELKV